MGFAAQKGRLLAVPSGVTSGPLYAEGAFVASASNALGHRSVGSPESGSSVSPLASRQVLTIGPALPGALEAPHHIDAAIYRLLQPRTAPPTHSPHRLRHCERTL